MPPPTFDALTSATLKYLREEWWDDTFTSFLAETLRPRAGNRILDVGCGEGLAEVHIGRLHVSQLRLFGIDLILERVMVAQREAAAHNQRVGYATADARALPFRAGVFDATFCVAVLQHIRNVETAVAELARVTVEGGRILAVEPDNSARYWYSTASAGQHAFETARRFFAAMSADRAEPADPAVGPHLAPLFVRCGIEPIAVRLFPVAQTTLGAPVDDVWIRRRRAIERIIAAASSDAVRSAGREYLEVLSAYAAEATQMGRAFVEIQHTMLFAAVGQKAA